MREASRVKRVALYDTFENKKAAVAHNFTSKMNRVAQVKAVRTSHEEDRFEAMMTEKLLDHKNFAEAKINVELEKFKVCSVFRARSFL